MRAPRVRCDQAGLDAIATALARSAERNAEMLRHLQAAVGRLSGGDWVGAGADAFYAEMAAEIFPALARLARALEAAQAGVGQIQRIWLQAECDAAAVLKGDSGGAVKALGRPAQSGGGLGTPAPGWGDAVWQAASDFFGGAGDEVRDMLTGLWQVVHHPILTAEGLYRTVRDDPWALWQALKKPYADALNSGHPWRVAGRAAVFVLTFVAGAKGADKAAKAAEAARAAEAIRAAELLTVASAEAAGDAVTAAGALKSIEDAIAASRLASALRAEGLAEAAGRAGRLLNPANRALTVAELTTVRRLVSFGHTVEVLADSQGIPNGPRMADVLIDGVKMELKTISNVTSPNQVMAIKRIMEKAAAQSPNVLMDLTDQPGITRTVAQEAADRAVMSSGKLASIRCIGPDFDFTVLRR